MMNIMPFLLALTAGAGRRDRQHAAGVPARALPPAPREPLQLRLAARVAEGHFVPGARQDRPELTAHARLGKFDPAVYEQLRKGDDPEAVRARIEGMAGPSGFMLFRTSDHGAILRLVGQQRKAVQYLVGNPLFAVEMTRHAIGAALYAPLRVLIYEDGGGACVEYDLPSSLFGQFKDERVDRVAASLDRKLADLVAEATR
jgi:uncharacterized protein (DUF302 family)